MAIRRGGLSRGQWLIACLLISGLAVALSGCAGLRSGNAYRPLATHPRSIDSREGTRVDDVTVVSARTAWIAITGSEQLNPHINCLRGHTRAACLEGNIAVFRTDDGGVHWRRRLLIRGSTRHPPQGVPFAGLKFFRGGAGLVLITFDEAGRPVLLRTSDGGGSWHRSPFLSSSAFGNGYDLDFVDAKHGWVIADRSAATGMEWLSLYRTVDGGRTWEKIAGTGHAGQVSSIPAYGDKNFLTFRSPTTGWLAGSDNSGVAELYLSRDGGRHWRLQRLPSLPGQTPRSPVTKVAYAPEFYSRRSGVEPVAAYFPNGSGGRWKVFLYSTVDGGLHWVRPRPLPFARVDVFEIRDAGHWWLGAGTTIWRSQDMGHTWRAAALPIRGDALLSSLWFVDDRVGLAVERYQMGGWDNEALFRSVDGRKRWQAVAVPRSVGS